MTGIPEWYPPAEGDDVWTCLTRIDEILRDHRAAVYEWLEPADVRSRIVVWDRLMTTQNDVVIVIEDDKILRPPVFAEPPALGTFLWKRELIVDMLRRFPEIRDTQGQRMLCYYWLVMARGDENECRMGESPYYVG